MSLRAVTLGTAVAIASAVLAVPLGCSSDEASSASRSVDAGGNDSSATEGTADESTRPGTPLVVSSTETVEVAFTVLNLMPECGVVDSSGWVRVDLAARSVHRGVYEWLCDPPDAGADAGTGQVRERVEKKVAEAKLSAEQVDRVVAATATVNVFRSEQCLGFDGTSYVVAVGPAGAPRARYRDGISFDCDAYATGLPGLFRTLSALVP